MIYSSIPFTWIIQRHIWKYILKNQIKYLVYICIYIKNLKEIDYFHWEAYTRTFQTWLLSSYSSNSYTIIFPMIIFTELIDFSQYIYLLSTMCSRKLDHFLLFHFSFFFFLTLGPSTPLSDPTDFDSSFLPGFFVISIFHESGIFVTID